MALLGIQTNGITQVYGVDGAYQRIRAAGFDAADVSLNLLLSRSDMENGIRPALLDGDDEALFAAAAPYREAAEKHGIVNAQAHAPYPTWWADGGEYNEFLLQVMEKCLMVCPYIGCDKLVIHPAFPPYEQALSLREEWDLNLSRFSRLIPAARRAGVTILLENMFTRYNKKIYEGCCSDFSLAARYVDALNDMAGEARFGFCLDTGHALLLGKDIRRAMEQLGHRILAFHLHDNNGVDDQHLAPYMGLMDWNRFAEGLRAIGYHGHLSFETHRTFTHAFDPDLIPEALGLIAASGRLIAERAGI